MAGNISKSTKLISDIIKFVKQQKTFDRVLDGMKIISAGDGKCVAEFQVDEQHQNSGGTLHGGYSAMVVDCISTYALMTHEKGSPGVSVNINMTYYKAAFTGDCIIVDANTIRAGRNLAYLEVELKNKTTGDLVAKGSHTKFIGSM